MPPGSCARRATSPGGWAPAGGTCGSRRREQLRRSDRMSDPIKDPVAFVDQRTASAPLLRKGLRYLFPDHWSFLLGEVAMYAFIVLVGTGVFLTLFYDDSTSTVVYHGPYKPLDGQEMTHAYKSVLDLSTVVK